MGEEVAVFVVAVTGGGVDARELFGGWGGGEKDGFDRVVGLALPCVWRERLALGSGGCESAARGRI